MKILKGCIGAVLSWGHPAIEEVILSCPGMITLWVLRTVLVPCSGGVTNMILFCEHHSVTFRRVNGRVELEQVLDSVDKNCKALVLVAAKVEWQNSGALGREFNRSRPFRCQRLSSSVQLLTTLVSALA